MGKCKFLNIWLNKDDCQGHQVKQWGQRHSDEELYCNVCQKTINISKGFQAITQHAKMEKHKQQMNIKLSPSQLHISLAGCVPVSSSGSSTSLANPESLPRTVQLYSVRDRITAAELMWAMKCVASDYSFLSCNGLREVFQVMWGESVVGDFSLGNNKVRYMITDALSPYFKDQQKQEMDGSFFTLLYDETTNAAGKSEFLTSVRYWSNKHQKIICEHLQMFFLNSGSAPVLVETLNSAMTKASLSSSNLLMLGSDGPNVNMSVFKMMNKEISVSRKKELINIGTCNVHTIHNAFLKGLSELGDDVSELVYSVYHYFDHWPKRWASFSEIQKTLKLPCHQFIKHCSSRWLTLKPAAERLLEQWNAIRKYFIDYIPKKKQKISNTSNYLKIVRLLKKPTMKAEILFVISSASVFDQVKILLQKEEPLIHVLYSEVETLIRTLMGRICKIDSLRDMKIEDIETSLQLDKLLPLTDILTDDKITSALKSVSDKERNLFLLNVRKHYLQSIRHIVKKSCLNLPILKCFSCFHPTGRLTAESIRNIVMVAKIMPFNVCTDLLLDEWKLLQIEIDEKGSNKLPIDTYWVQFLKTRDATGIDPKYPNVSKIVKAALSLSHGNSDVERGFSASGRELTSDRASMSERTLDAIMTIKSELRAYNNNPYLIPITKKLCDMGRVAYSAYNAYLEAKRREEQEKLREEHREREKLKAAQLNQHEFQHKRKSIAEEEQKLKAMKKHEEETADSASKLLKEANLRLKKALKNKDLKEAALAQAMIEGVETVQNDAEEQRRSVQVVEKSVEKRRSQLISEFFVKLPNKS